MPSAYSEFLYTGKVRFLHCTPYFVHYIHIYFLVHMHLIVVMIGDGAWDNGYGTMKPKNLISSILGGTPGKPKSIVISNPHDFRQVSLHLVAHFLMSDFIDRSIIYLHSLSGIRNY